MPERVKDISNLTGNITFVIPGNEPGIIVLITAINRYIKIQ